MNKDSHQADVSAGESSEIFNVTSEWLPIETAPKDGTEIILGMFRPEFEDAIVMNSAWIDAEERGCYWLDWDGCPRPTHWMPLVPPQKEPTHD